MASPGTVAPLPAITAPPSTAEHRAEGFDSGLAWKRVRFRGVDYTLYELEIGIHDDIQQKATRTRAMPDGTDQEYVDNVLQNRMMLEKSLTIPARNDPGYVTPMKMGTRLFLNLQRVMQELHYDREEDALRNAKGEELPTGEAESKGN